MNGHEVRIGGEEHEFVAISVYARTYPDSPTFFDRNWLDARVDVAAGGFRGRATGHLRAEDFVSFLDELSRLIGRRQGSASFRTLEGWLQLRITANVRGHVEVDVVMLDDPSVGNRLVCCLHLDQTYLRTVLEGLRDIADSFPVQIGTEGHA